MSDNAETTVGPVKWRPGLIGPSFAALQLDDTRIAVHSLPGRGRTWTIVALAIFGANGLLFLSRVHPITAGLVTATFIGIGAGVGTIVGKSTARKQFQNETLDPKTVADIPHSRIRSIEFNQSKIPFTSSAVLEIYTESECYRFKGSAAKLEQIADGIRSRSNGLG